MRLNCPFLLLGCLPMASSSQSSAQEPKLRDTLTGHADSVMSVAYSPDGKTLASGSADETVRLWDVATGKERATLKSDTNSACSLVFSPDGGTLASGGKAGGSASKNRTIRLWAVQTGKEWATIKGHDEVVLSVVFSPDGRTLASGSGDKTIKLWDVATDKE
jgi:WD40 repeat protein